MPSKRESQSWRSSAQLVRRVRANGQMSEMTHLEDLRFPFSH
jgi:hypothetical protein